MRFSLPAGLFLSTAGFPIETGASGICLSTVGRQLVLIWFLHASLCPESDILEQVKSSSWFTFLGKISKSEHSRIFWKLGNVICQSIRSNQHESSKKSRSISCKCYFLFSSRNHPASGSFASISRFSSTAVLSIKLEDLRFSTISRRHSLLHLECTCQFRSTFVSSLKKDAFDNCLLGKMD